MSTTAFGEIMCPFVSTPMLAMLGRPNRAIFVPSPPSPKTLPQSYSQTSQSYNQYTSSRRPAALSRPATASRRRQVADEGQFPPLQTPDPSWIATTTPHQFSGSDRHKFAVNLAHRQLGSLTEKPGARVAKHYFSMRRAKQPIIFID
jgi:hypothetical protein